MFLFGDKVLGIDLLLEVVAVGVTLLLIEAVVVRAALLCHDVMVRGLSLILLEVMAVGVTLPPIEGGHGRFARSEGFPLQGRLAPS